MYTNTTTQFDALQVPGAGGPASEASGGTRRGAGAVISPPLSKEGGNGKIAFSVDWLTATLPHWEIPGNGVVSLEQLVPHGLLLGSNPDMRPVAGYNTVQSLQTTSGAVVGSVSWHTRLPENRVCFNFFGEQLAALRLEGYSIERLIAHFINLEGKITRLDLVLDVFDVPHASPFDFYDAFQAGELQTSARSHSIISSNTRGIQGSTFYLGSPQSLKRLRVYDKFAEYTLKYNELPGGVSSWVRLELTVRKEVATAYAPLIAAHGLASVIRSAIVHFVDPVTIPWAAAALTGRDTVELPEIPRPQPSLNRWLSEQVTPIVAREAVRGNAAVLRVAQACGLLEEAKENLWLPAEDIDLARLPRYDAAYDPDPEILQRLAPQKLDLLTRPRKSIYALEKKIVFRRDGSTKIVKVLRDQWGDEVQFSRTASRPRFGGVQ